MNSKNTKGYLTLQEALENPEVANVRVPVKPHPKPCTDPDCIWHGRFDLANIPSLDEERWRIIDEGDRWAVWFIPRNHPERWAEWAAFTTEAEAIQYVKSL